MNSLSLERDGCRLFYDVRGDGPPVLLIQGVGVHGDGWSPQIDGLRDRYSCLSFDNRGMGRSQPLAGPLTIDRMADDALAIMDAVGWDAAHVVGHSMGGLVALELALKARERVRSLSLLCTFADGGVPTRLSPRMMWIGTLARVGSRRSRRRAFLRIVMPPDALAAADRDALAEQLGGLFGHDIADQPPVVMKQLGAMRGYDLTSRLPELGSIPTLVVSATHDPIAPPYAGRAIAAGVPGARYVEIPDASHGVPVQHADRINDLLLEHFASVVGSR
jgi:pimeloyl-ACP methyl ester carboxylesterase